MAKLKTVPIKKKKKKKLTKNCHVITLLSALRTKSNHFGFKGLFVDKFGRWIMEAAPIIWNMMEPTPSMDQERLKYGLKLAACLFDKLAVWFNIALYPVTKCIQFPSVNFYAISIKNLKLSSMYMSHS